MCFASSSWLLMMDNDSSFEILVSKHVKLVVDAFLVMSFVDLQDDEIIFLSVLLLVSLDCKVLVSSFSFKSTLLLVMLKF